ncbi:MAG: class I SAM-dependent methyltransferase, partial [Ruminococcus sp.]|nr:class I SAM-dependent methyltransferase [Ruminococcus sp.]
YDYHRQELHSLLTPEEYSQAKASSLNSHYTPQIIIDAMYKALQNMDLPRDAKILEPACGTGNFISRMPHSFGNAEVTGVELDSVMARIAHQINRENDNVKIINSGFENSGLENESFDLAIGNVPFGDYNMNDPDYVQDWRIHDAFFRKALDKVASG